MRAAAEFVEQGLEPFGVRCALADENFDAGMRPTACTASIGASSATATSTGTSAAVFTS